jgi:hypothetical protein
MWVASRETARGGDKRRAEGGGSSADDRRARRFQVEGTTWEPLEQHPLCLYVVSDDATAAHEMSPRAGCPSLSNHLIFFIALFYCPCCDDLDAILILHRLTGPKQSLTLVVNAIGLRIVLLPFLWSQYLVLQRLYVAKPVNGRPIL